MRNDPRTHGLWERSAPPAPATAALEGDVTVDVAVVGAGFTGLSAALHLAEAGRGVAVLEAEEIGFGGSGRNVGLVNAGMWVMPDEVPAALGDVHGERLLALLGEAPAAVFELVEKHGIDCEAERQGTLHCAVGEKGLAELRERARQWQRRGAAVRLLGAEEAARLIGTTAYSGALLDMRAGTIQPLGYARGLARAALAAGAAIFTHSPVRTARDEDGAWTLSGDAGTVRARHVVLATDAYASGIWPEIRQAQVHLPYFNLATAPLSDNLRRSILPERQGAWDTADILSSFRFDRAGRLVFGSIGALRGPGSTVHRNWGRRAMARLFPQLDGVGFELEWYGQIGMTENSLPRFCRPARDVVAFSGYNGRGIAPGTVFGRALARLVTGELAVADLPLPETAARPVRFRAMREAWYEIGAEVAHAAGARF
ncbi:NAD(P)/FAD-dependent oxidoreductase [Aureimonas leprariae]|uniref:FAD-binding oxidoreductase n=1 Tax=Plantimonas leprariae TaxID=2615207 RepID=A0A7V7PLC7_9HYPH|nr:FAD-binding oxidoreductase [Aureimonas leprariae]KAB0677011.1 FAD-binding oxidoreductase [Aureimonas leprariae]